jgi:hypothetical protein
VAPVDGRKQAASLALLVEQSLGHNVFEPALYIFSNRRRMCISPLGWNSKLLATTLSPDAPSVTQTPGFGSESGDLSM